MRLLLDTHIFLWMVLDSPALPKHLRAPLADPENEAFVSAASAWEISTKSRLGKLPHAQAVAEDISGCVRAAGLAPLAITMPHAERAGALASSHRDPFDRMLVAQAQIEGLTLVSVDPAMAEFDVSVLD